METRRTANKKMNKLYWPSQKHSTKRLIVLLERKQWRGWPKKFRHFAWDGCSPPTFSFVVAPLCTFSRLDANSLVRKVGTNVRYADTKMQLGISNKVANSPPECRETRLLMHKEENNTFYMSHFIFLIPYSLANHGQYRNNSLQNSFHLTNTEHSSNGHIPSRSFGMSVFR